MFDCDLKKLSIALVALGLAIVILGTAVTPSLVVSLYSPGSAKASTLNSLEKLRLAAIAAGALVTAFGALSMARPGVFQWLGKALNGRMTIILVLVFCLASLAVRIKYGLGIYDEGISDYGAIRVLHGDIPYKDFWFIYTPGEIYALALLFKILGASVIVGRCLTVISYIVILACTYYFCKHMSDRAYACLVVLLAAAWAGITGVATSPLPEAVMFVLLGCACVVEYLNKRSYILLAAGGVLGGLAAFFSHDIGGYGLATMSVVILLFSYAKTSGTSCIRAWSALKTLSFYFAGALAIVVPAAAYLLLLVPLNDLVSQLIMFPFTTYAEYRSLPYLSPLAFQGSGGVLLLMFGVFESIVFYFPILTFAAAIYWLGFAKSCRKILHRWILFLLLVGGALVLTKIFVFIAIAATILLLAYGVWNGRELDEKYWAAYLLLLVGLAMLNKASVRADMGHLLGAAFPALILFLWMVQDMLLVPVSEKKHSEALRSLAAVFLISLLVISFAVTSFRPIASEFSISSDKAVLSLDRANGVVLPAEEVTTMQQAIAYVKENVPSDERIFVGGPRHDMIRINDVMFYFLADRESATKYEELHPGVITTGPVQEEVIRALDSDRVKYIILWSGDGNSTEPNLSSKSSNITLLDTFINVNYAPEETFGHYTIYRRISPFSFS